MEELHSRKFDAEIAKLIAETMKIQQEVLKTQQESTKIQHEAMKIQQEAKWYPFVATAALFAAAIGVVKIFL